MWQAYIMIENHEVSRCSKLLRGEQRVNSHGKIAHHKSSNCFLEAASVSRDRSFMFLEIFQCVRHGNQTF
jgi:hypothetical protein